MKIVRPHFEGRDQIGRSSVLPVLVTACRCDFFVRPESPGPDLQTSKGGQIERVPFTLQDFESVG